MEPVAGGRISYRKPVDIYICHIWRHPKQTHCIWTVECLLYGIKIISESDYYNILINRNQQSYMMAIPVDCLRLRKHIKLYIIYMYISDFNINVSVNFVRPVFSNDLTNCTITSGSALVWFHDDSSAFIIMQMNQVWAGSSHDQLKNEDEEGTGTGTTPWK